MFKVLAESGEGVLGVEVSRTYSPQDMRAFKKALEAEMARTPGRINLLVKLDRLALDKVSIETYMADCSYVISRGERLGRVAMVGSSPEARAAVAADRLLLAPATRGIDERYFDIANLEQAWAFVRGQSPT